MFVVTLVEVLAEARAKGRYHHFSSLAGCALGSGESPRSVFYRFCSYEVVGSVLPVGMLVSVFEALLLFGFVRITVNGTTIAVMASVAKTMPMIVFAQHDDGQWLPGFSGLLLSLQNKADQKDVFVPTRSIMDNKPVIAVVVSFTISWNNVRLIVGSRT